MRPIRRLILCACVSLGLGPSLAHQGIHERVDDLTRRITTAPGDAALFLERGELHRVRGDWDAAAADYARSRALDPELTVVDRCEGRMLLEAGRPAEARRILDRYLERRPADGRGYELRGRARALDGDPLGAARDLGHALALSSGNTPDPHLYLEQARALAAAGAQHRGAALAVLERGLERLGSPVTLELEALGLEEAMGHVEAALRRVDRLARSTRRPERWLVRRALILEAAGRVAEAREAFGRAGEAMARLPTALQGRGGAPALSATIEDGLARLGTAPVAEEREGS